MWHPVVPAKEGSDLSLKLVLGWFVGIYFVLGWGYLRFPCHFIAIPSILRGHKINCLKITARELLAEAEVGASCLKAKPVWGLLGAQEMPGEQRYHCTVLFLFQVQYFMKHLQQPIHPQRKGNLHHSKTPHNSSCKTQNMGLKWKCKMKVCRVKPTAGHSWLAGSQGAGFLP